MRRSNGCDPLHFSSGAVHRSLNFRRLDLLRTKRGREARLLVNSATALASAHHWVLVVCWQWIHGAWVDALRTGPEALGKDPDQTLRIVLFLSVVLGPTALPRARAAQPVSRNVAADSSSLPWSSPAAVTPPVWVGAGMVHLVHRSPSQRSGDRAQRNGSAGAAGTRLRNAARYLFRR